MAVIRRPARALFERHFDALYRFFCAKTVAAAEDLTQETLLACVKGKERIEAGSKFRAYMFAVARRILYHHYDKTRRKGDREVGQRSVADLSPGQSTIMAKREEEKLFLAALRSLPLDYQIAVELQTWEGLTGPEIAAVLDVPEGTIRSRLRRARLQLEVRIRELAESPDVLESTLTGLDGWAANVRGLLRPA